MTAYSNWMPYPGTSIEWRVMKQASASMALSPSSNSFVDFLSELQERIAILDPSVRLKWIMEKNSSLARPLK